MTATQETKPDPAFCTLLQAYQSDYKNSAEKILWIFDENALENTANFSANQHTQCISNRVDIAARLKQNNAHVEFSDFDFSAIEPHSLDAIFYRISKEKPVVHYIINQAKTLLKSDGYLYLAGLKNEGAKTYLDKAATVLGCAKATKKTGLAYSAKLACNHQDTAPLNDSDYTRLRPIKNAPMPLQSKPGLFGWQQIDPGSEYFIATLKSFYAQNPVDHALSYRLLDLGCGYGYLSIMLALKVLPRPPENLVLTDNSAAALIAARDNCHKHQLAASIVAADAGEGIEGKFDIVVCNPPFHQGFSVNNDLTRKFLNAAAKSLHRNGDVFFVVNSFIPLEDKARKFFMRCQRLAHNGRFSVYHMREPIVPSHR